MSMLTENGWTLGGESSGHIICLDKCTTGDGIVAALQVLQAMVDQRLSLHQIKQGMRIYPQTLINVRLTGGEIMRAGALDECESISKALHKARSELGSAGRVSAETLRHGTRDPGDGRGRRRAKGFANRPGSGRRGQVGGDLAPILAQAPGPL